eukprot:926511-Amphidinium_carterae.2
MSRLHVMWTHGRHNIAKEKYVKTARSRCEKPQKRMKVERRSAQPCSPHHADGKIRGSATCSSTVLRRATAGRQTYCLLSSSTHLRPCVHMRMNQEHRVIATTWDCHKVGEASQNWTNYLAPSRCAAAAAV